MEVISSIEQRGSLRISERGKPLFHVFPTTCHAKKRKMMSRQGQFYNFDLKEKNMKTDQTDFA